MQQHKISLSGPPDLLAVLPYHLGYHPLRSVVLVCLRDRQLDLVARFDVVPDLSEASAVAVSILEVLRREAPTGVMVIGYEEEPGESAPLSEAIATGLALDHIPLVDRLVVRGGRWTGLMCTCCPDEPVPAPHDVPAVATFVGLGRTALASRDELATAVRPLEPAPTGLREAIDAWIRDVVDQGRLLAPLRGSDSGSRRPVTWADLALTAWADLLAGRFDWREIPPGQLRLLLGSVRDRAVRDGIIAIICPGSLSREALEPRLVELLDEYLAPVIDGDDERAEDDWDDGDWDDGDWDDGDWDDGEDGGVDEQDAEVLDPCAQEPDEDGLEALAGLEDLPVLRGAARSEGPERRGVLSGRALIRPRLERLCRLAPDEHAAPVLAMTAAHAWFAGDGAATRVAIERALEVEPGHVLARLLAQLLDRGIRPPGLAA